MLQRLLWTRATSSGRPNEWPPVHRIDGSQVALPKGRVRFRLSPNTLMISPHARAPGLPTVFKRTAATAFCSAALYYSAGERTGHEIPAPVR